MRSRRARTLYVLAVIGMCGAWWNAADASEWRWQVEFYNHR